MFEAFLLGVAAAATPSVPAGKLAHPGLVAVASPSAATSQASPSPSDPFQHKTETIVRRSGVPGAALVVSTSEGLAAAHAYGLRRAGGTDPIRLTDRFAIASNAKPMTATLAALLVERGKIGWDSTPADVWPREVAAMNPVTRRVTLRQLLSHSAGLAAFTDNEEVRQAPRLSGSPREQRARFARWLVSQPPKHPMGRHLYSNAGFALAGAMLEQVSGQSWEDLLRASLFEPLAMASCVTGARGADLVVPHRYDGKSFIPNQIGEDPLLPDFLAPAGLVHCSAPDLARFGEVHLLGLLGRHPLLKPETFKLLHTKMPGQDYGLGWNVEDFGSVHRGGLSDRWHSVIIVSPRNRLVAVVTVNARSLPLTLELMNDLLQAAFDQFAVRQKS